MRGCDLIVVGGGPAGMMAAGRAAEKGRRVLLLERGPSLGRKLLLTGGGRCNLTNTSPPGGLISAFGPTGDFLRKALAAFGPDELRQWLQRRGVETVVEAGGRVFPAARDSRVVLETLVAYMDGGRVEVRMRHRVESLIIERSRVGGVLAACGELRAPRVLVATGALSYPATGSTGDGYSLARQAGHKVSPTFPAIAGLETEERWPRSLKGTAVRATQIVARLEGGRRVANAAGDALCTHYGLSGPAVFDVSAAVVNVLRRGHRVWLELDLAPEVAAEALEQEMIEAAAGQSHRTLRRVLSARVPLRMAAVLLGLAGVDPDRRMGALTRLERHAIVRQVKHVQLHVTRPRPVEEAIVTGGGVSVGELDDERMESRLIPGLFFAGEVLDVHGPTGGFNLQQAFSTGYVAGSAA